MRNCANLPTFYRLLAKRGFRRQHTEPCKQFMVSHAILKDCTEFHTPLFRHEFHLNFTMSKEKAATFDVTAWFSVWTSQGLNLGPPDYESVALTNWATSPWLQYFWKSDAKVHCFGQISKYFFIKRNKRGFIHLLSRGYHGSQTVVDSVRAYCRRVQPSWDDKDYTPFRAFCAYPCRYHGRVTSVFSGLHPLVLQ